MFATSLSSPLTQVAPLKILTCHNFYQQTGGEDLSYRDEVRMLRDFGHEVVEYTRNNAELSGQSAAKLFKATVWSRRTFDEVNELMATVRPDIVHCTNTLPLISPSIYDAAQRYRVPVVQALRNYRMFCVESMCMRGQVPCQACLGKKIAWRALWHRCYRKSLPSSATVALLQSLARRQGFYANRVHAFYTLSQFARQKMIEHGVPAERICVKPNFIADPPSVGGGTGNYAIFVGRLAEAKGLRVLLSAWQGLDIPLKIVGSGPLADLVHQHVQAHAHLEWLGELELERIYQLLGEAKFLIFPSIGLETFGRTLMEAFAVGTPVIAARESSVPEMVCEGRTGFTYEPLSSDELRGLVRRVFSSPSPQLRVQARAEFERNYSPRINHQILMDIYQQAISRAGD